MKALVKAKAEPGLWLDDVPEPVVGINDVLIKVHKTGICGTDLHIYNNWIIIGPNTVDLWLQNNEYTTAIFSHPDGNVSIGYSAGMIRVGWIQEHKAYSVTGMPQTAYAYQINGFNADIYNWPVLMVRPSQMTKFYLPPIFPPRAQVKLLLD
jgi:hypothetical protein